MFKFYELFLNECYKMFLKSVIDFVLLIQMQNEEMEVLFVVKKVFVNIVGL